MSQMNFASYGAVPEADPDFYQAPTDSARPRRLLSFFAVLVLAGVVTGLFLLLEGTTLLSGVRTLLDFHQPRCSGLFRSHIAYYGPSRI